MLANSSERQHSPSTGNLSSNPNVSNSYEQQFSNKELGNSNKIFKSIFQLLPYQTMLEARCVCKEWNTLIENGPNPSSTLIWERGRLLFDVKSINDKFIPKTPIKQPIWILKFKEFQKLHSLTKSNCPNFHFRYLDARYDVSKRFFQKFGTQIETLRLDCCMLSLVTFQRITFHCKRLENLEIRGMFHYLMDTQTLFVSSREETLQAFKNLRSLTLETTVLAHLAISKKEQQDIKTQNINPTVIQEMLLSAPNLEKLRLNAFGIGTVASVLWTLTHPPTLHNLTQLEFLNITDYKTAAIEIRSKSLDDIALSHLKLTKFAMTFLPYCYREELTGTDREHAFFPYTWEVLDPFITNLLISHQSTLEEVNLENCSVTDAIFMSPNDGRTFQLKALRRLIVYGTRINKLSTDCHNSLYDYIKLLERKKSEENFDELLTIRVVDEIFAEVFRDLNNEVQLSKEIDGIGAKKGVPSWFCGDNCKCIIERENCNCEHSFYTSCQATFVVILSFCCLLGIAYIVSNYEDSEGFPVENEEILEPEFPIPILDESIQLPSIWKWIDLSYIFESIQQWFRQDEA